MSVVGGRVRNAQQAQGVYVFTVAHGEETVGHPEVVSAHKPLGDRGRLGHAYARVGRCTGGDISALEDYSRR